QVAFANSTTGANSYLWNFGDGSTSTGMNPNHTYSSLGNYDVTLIATASNGCKDTMVKPAYINLVKPEVTITATPVNSCAPSLITFTANVISNQPVTSYQWDFGDG